MSAGENAAPNPNRRAAPLGVFDSGLGGLTAVRELLRILPGEDIVYFGDTGRVPYGSRGRCTIVAYARQDIAFLLSQNVKLLLAACGTVGSTFPESESAALPVPYMDVVRPAAAAAAAATKNGRVGILGTEATIASGSYEAALKALLPGVRTAAAACPLFVPLVENGHFAADDALAALAAKEYLPPIAAAGADTVILGCTHYPLLAGVIAAALPFGVTLIDPGREAALALKRQLAAQGLLNPRKTGGRLRAFVSDDPARFDGLCALFLGPCAAAGGARRVAIEEYGL